MKKTPLTTEPTIPHKEGLAMKRTSSGLAGALDFESELAATMRVLAFWVFRNSLQNRHLIARACIVSAQKGHGFVDGAVIGVISIVLYIGKRG